MHIIFLQKSHKNLINSEKNRGIISNKTGKNQFKIAVGSFEILLLKLLTISLISDLK